MTDNTTPMTTQEADWHTDPKLSENWKFRFRFFEKYGAPGAIAAYGGMHSAEARVALKQLSFGDRVKISSNLYAFFFGFIYYGFFLKLWRQALILIAISLVYGIISSIFDFPDDVDRGVGIAYALVCAYRANSLYYLKRTRGDIGWTF
ncbi:MAG: DUF2628 domain-containing protein [Gallionellaceae bacterium]|jgi:hypothetical protein|nr:DUF2628 domain-containing protein [Gallionellaceae bacterium]